MSKKKNNLGDISFEQAMEELEQIVAQLENDDLSLEESLNLYERGVSLTAYCTQKINEAEGKITILLKNHTGCEEQPFGIAGEA